MRLDFEHADRCGLITVTLSRRNLLNFEYRLGREPEASMRSINAYAGGEELWDCLLRVLVSSRLPAPIVQAGPRGVGLGFGPNTLAYMMRTLETAEAVGGCVSELRLASTEGRTVVVRWESDEAHYTNRGFPPGEMRPEAEAYIRSAAGADHDATESGQ